MENIKIKMETFNAIVVHDKVAESYTIFLDGLSGPVVSAPKLEDAKTKFDEAMKLACSVRNLNVFAAALKAHDAQQRETLAKSTSLNPEIQYREIEASLC